MQDTEQKKVPTQEEIDQATAAWTRDAFQRAQKHLAEKGILPQTVYDKESRFLAPFCAVWKIKTQQGKTFWVISGDLPTDHIEVTAAPSAREAIRYFSFQWQLKAQQIIDQGVRDKTQADFANLLIARAHGLYELSAKEQLWVNEP